jgi:cytochrome c1
MRSIDVICLAIIGALLISTAPAIAQQKTVKACQEEWRANKAANQAKGITEKVYVAQCRGGSTTAQPAQQTPPTTATPAAPKTTSAAQQKTVKACRDEWRANKAANQAKGITERAYVAQCRGGESAAQPAQQTATPPAAAPAPPKTTTVPAPQATPSTRSTAQPAPAPASTAAPAGANQYSTEAQAKARCGSGLVVWANLDSKIYHFAGHKSYGNTKTGAYMCETDATRGGMRAAKSEKRP